MAGEPIVVVDDNPANLSLATMVLQAKGFQVRSATSGKELLELLQTFTPRLILMDIQLPDANGLQLTKQLKESKATRDILVVALTAYAMKGDASRAKAVGCDGYITKPIDTRTLGAVVAEFIASQVGRPA